MTASRQTDRAQSATLKEVLWTCLETRPGHLTGCGDSTCTLFAYRTEWLSQSHVGQKDLVQGGAKSRNHIPTDYTFRFQMGQQKTRKHLQLNTYDLLNFKVYPFTTSVIRGNIFGLSCLASDKFSTVCRGEHWVQQITLANSSSNVVH
jgi:hypothetical protein